MTDKLNINDYRIGDSTYKLSLSKLVNKQIKDIIGWPNASDFGGTVLTVKEIIFEDGTKLVLNAEHGHPFIMAEQDGFPTLRETSLDDLKEQY